MISSSTWEDDAGENSQKEVLLSGPEGSAFVWSGWNSSDLKWAIKSDNLAVEGWCWRCLPVIWLIADHKCRGDFLYCCNRSWKYSFLRWRYILFTWLRNFRWWVIRSTSRRLVLITLRCTLFCLWIKCRSSGNIQGQLFSFNSYECQPSALPCLRRPETYLAILPTCCLLRQRLKWPYANLGLVQETLVRHHTNFFSAFTCNLQVQLTCPLPCGLLRMSAPVHGQKYQCPKQSLLAESLCWSI